MMNTVTLVGFVGNNPEVRTAQSGAAITSLSLATTRSFKDSEGNRQTETKWHRITCFNGVGKCGAEHVTMGAMVIHLIRNANPHAWDEISQGARIVETNREAIKRCTNSARKYKQQVICQVRIDH